MIALHKFQSDISTNSREIEDQNIEKSPSLIIARLVSMATKKNRWFDFLEKVLPLSYNWSAPTVKKSGRSDQYCGLYIVWRQTSQKKLTGQDIIWKPLGERVLCEIAEIASSKVEMITWKDLLMIGMTCWWWRFMRNSDPTVTSTSNKPSLLPWPMKVIVVQPTSN